MAEYDNKAFNAMQDSTKSKADNLIPKDQKEKIYDISAYGRDSLKTMYTGFTNKEDKTMFWKHPTNQLLYSSEGQQNAANIGSSPLFVKAVDGETSIWVAMIQLAGTLDLVDTDSITLTFGFQYLG